MYFRGGLQIRSPYIPIEGYRSIAVGIGFDGLWVGNIFETVCQDIRMGTSPEKGAEFGNRDETGEVVDLLLWICEEGS